MLSQRKIIDLAGLLALACAVGLIGWRCWTLRRPADEPNHPNRAALADFQDVVYYPTRAALAGVNPYDARPAAEGGVYYSKFPAGNSFPLYAPLIFLPSLPFAVLPLTAAEILWWLVNLALLLLYAYVALRLADLPCHVGTVAGLAAVLLLSRPGHANFYFGALALPLALATFAAWHFADRRPWLSAVCLAASCIKPTFGGPLVVLMLLGGSYRATLYGLALAVAANLAVFAAFLPGEFFHPRPLEMLAHNQAVIDDDSAVDPLKSISRVDFPFVVERFYGRHFPGYVRYGLTFLVLFIAGWHLRWLRLVDEPVNHGNEPVNHGNEPVIRGLRAAVPSTSNLLATALACLAIVICIYHNIYDALLAVIPAAAAWRAIGADKPRRDRWLLAALMICFAVPALNYFTSKQLLTLLADNLPALAQITSQPVFWMLLSTFNGVCFTIAACLLLAIARRVFRDRAVPSQPA